MSEPITTTVDVDAWIDAAADNPDEQRIRRVMRVILFAVANSPFLKSRMVMKGGVLLALQYATRRHTRDVDFSTSERVQQADVPKILAELERSLQAAVREVDPEILCHVQSRKKLPPREEASFPTLRINIGYAVAGEKEHRRMVQGRDSTKTVTVDLSFNESTCITSSIALAGTSEITAYSLYDQIAEKYRALIQQSPELRDRVRRQDVYDIFRVIRNGYLATGEDKVTLMTTLEQKFAARSVPLVRDLIDAPEIARRSAKEYARLQDEIEDELPDFEEVFRTVRDFYHDLPWP